MVSISDTAKIFHDALESCDVDQLMGCYDDNAKIRIVDKNHPPSSPLELSGKQAILEYYRDVCSRGLSHTIESEVISENRMGFIDGCQYPDGTRVLATEMVEFSGGKISHETIVQAWDE